MRIYELSNYRKFQGEELFRLGKGLVRGHWGNSGLYYAHTKVKREGERKLMPRN
jgi:hypothetical protein